MMRILTWLNLKNLKKIDKRLDFFRDTWYNDTNSVELSLTLLQGGVFQMAYVINDDCISCGACEAECPVNAISEGDGKYVINADECLDCGACAGACPVGAPVQE